MKFSFDERVHVVFVPKENYKKLFKFDYKGQKYDLYNNIPFGLEIHA